jgi:hypothetical protein
MMKKRIAAQLICTLSAVLFLGGCQTTQKKPIATEVPNSSVTYVKGADFVGVIKTIDKENKKITFYNTLLDEDEEYSYSGGTEIYSKNEREMSIDEVSVGEVYEVTNSKTEAKVTELRESADIIQLEDVSVTVDADEGRLTIDDVNYAYSDHLIALSDGKTIDPMEITSSDKVTFRGVKGQAYSVIVTKGHGYIQPTNFKDFVGGRLTVQGEAILPVSEGMLLTVPEGSQTLNFVNGDLTSSATVEVKRGKVTKLNVSRYQSQMPDTSRVTFKISPEGAELYINGSLTDYSKPVSLKYGNHSVKVVLEGYSDYSGVVQVQDSSATVKIDLAEETAEVDSEDDSSSSSVTSSDSSDDDSSSSTEYDTEHTITVSAPEGAAIYVDGTYKGVIPCSFTKMLGSVTLTLTKEGCTTKSYSVELPDDSKDISWSFPDLTAESEG